MKKILSISILIILFSCKKNKESNNFVGELPEKQNIDSLKQTDFVGTIENFFYKKKNYIYSPTLAFAWNKIQQKLPNIKIIEDKGIGDFILLNATKSNINSLNKDEYETEIIIKNQEIIATSELNLQLTFEPILEKFNRSIYFNDNFAVQGFGMRKWDNEKAEQLEIIYFLDNDNFIFKLKPKENNNELIFIKGLKSEKANSFKEVIEILKKKKNIGETEKKNSEMSWKYKLIEERKETFSIPELTFNIEKSYRTIEGQSFSAQNTIYTISKAHQRTALLLNNKGAKIESEAKITTITSAMHSEKTAKIDKHLSLNRTFFLIIKHSDQENPFFCAKIDNIELMNKNKVSAVKK